MKKSRNLKEKILLRISLKKDKLFIRDDFVDLGGYDQVGRALKKLIQEEQVIKIGYGLYVKTKVSPITGKSTIPEPLTDLAKKAFNKLRIKYDLPKSEHLYNSGESTQVPTGRMIAVKSRISRKIGYNGAFISYERSAQ